MRMRMLVVSLFLLLSLAFAQGVNEKTKTTVGTLGPATIEFLEPMTMTLTNSKGTFSIVRGRTEVKRISLKGTVDSPVNIEVIRDGKAILRISTSSDAMLTETSSKE